jgi:protein O-mannosyl-transferase
MSTARRIPNGGFASLLDAVGSVWTRCLVLATAGVVTHLPALQGEFIWDDDYLVRNNPLTKSPLLIFETFRHYLFIDSSSAHYRPVQNLSYCLDYILWYTNPWGFHLTNVLLHVASGIVLYFLLRRLLIPMAQAPGVATPAVAADGNRPIGWLAFFVALLWMVLPVHSAAVDYISGRADGLSFFFSCSGWLVVLRARKCSSKGLSCFLYAIACLLGLLALCSREIAVVWFILFVLHLLAIDRTTSKRGKIIAVICCLCLLGTYVGLRQLPPARSITDAPEHWSSPVRAVLMLRALGDYGRLLIWPSNLHMERTLFDRENYFSHASWRQSAATEYLSLVGCVVLLVLWLGCKRRGLAQQIRIFGAAWFLIAYLPISNIISLNATVAEHWLYLPSVGLLIFLAGSAFDFFGAWRRGLTAAACCAVIALGARSVLRSSDWQAEESFYARTLMAGGVTPRIRLNFAHALAKRGEYAKAEEILRRLVNSDPAYVLARNNLADVLAQQGKTARAEKILASTTGMAAATRKEAPRTWVAALNLAHLYDQQKNEQAALDVLEKARAEYPDTWELISCESEVQRRTNGPDAALRLIEDFARKNWWHYNAALALGRLYAQKGDVDLAQAALQRASRLDIHDVESLRLAVVIDLQQKKFDEARRTQLRAIARQPDQPRQYAMLSEIFEKMGRNDEARAALAKAYELSALVLGPSVVN